MEYKFDVAHAMKYGVEEAIMIQNFQFWLLKNKVNNKHQYDGRTWTYNSIRAFCELFPFWSARQIERILNSLIRQGVLMTGNYNVQKYDRTKWYAFVDEDLFLSIPTDHEDSPPFHQTVESNLPNCKIKLTISGNQNNQTVEPIPDIKPYIKPDIKHIYYAEDANDADESASTHREKRVFLEHVYLTDEEYQKLTDLLGEEKAQDYITRLNNYIHQIGKQKAKAKYKSHYHVILNWHRKDMAEIERRIKVVEALQQKREDEYFIDKSLNQRTTNTLTTPVTRRFLDD